MMKRGLFVILMLCVLFNSARSNDTLTACGDMDYPPFTYSQEMVGSKDRVNIKIHSEIMGVGPDVLNMIFGEHGITVDSKYVGNWKRCQIAVEDGDIDIIMGAYKTKEREQLYLYPETPLANDPVTIFVWKDRTFKFEHWDDLKGKKVGIARGVSTGERLDEWLKEHTSISVVTRRVQNYKKLKRGRIDFCIGGKYAELIQIALYKFEGKVVPLKNSPIVEKTYLAISKKSKFMKYILKLDEGLRKVHADGTLSQLINKHLEQFSIRHHDKAQ